MRLRSPTSAAASPTLGSIGVGTRTLPATPGVLVGVAVRGRILVPIGGRSAGNRSVGVGVMRGVHRRAVLRGVRASILRAIGGCLMGLAIGPGVRVVGLSY